MTTIATDWARIDRWLGRHAPGSAALLAPPADPAEIAAAERTLGVTFPPELVESLRCHNGFRDEATVLPADPLFSVADIVKHWQLNMELAGLAGPLEAATHEPPQDDDEDEEDDDEPWWHRLWLPFAGKNSDAWIYDLRPDAESDTARHWHDAGYDFSTDWVDLDDCLSATADILEGAGHPDRQATDLRPYLRGYGAGGDRLLWDTKDADRNGRGDPIRPAPVGR